MARRNENYRLFDKNNGVIKKYVSWVLDGKCTVSEGARLARVNRDSFNALVKTERAKLEKEEGDE